jgi:hypothetical protein
MLLNLLTSFALADTITLDTGAVIEGDLARYEFGGDCQISVTSGNLSGVILIVPCYRVQSFVRTTVRAPVPIGSYTPPETSQPPNTQPPTAQPPDSQPVATAPPASPPATQPPAAPPVEVPIIPMSFGEPVFEPEPEEVPVEGTAAPAESRSVRF